MKSEHMAIRSQALRVLEPPREAEVNTLAPLQLILVYVRSGFTRANELLPLALVLVVINILFGLVCTLPLYGILEDSLSTSLMGERSLGIPNVNWFIEFLSSNQGFLESLSSLILWVGLGYMALNTLLTAGLLEVLHAEHRFTFRRFFGGIVSHGTKFLRLWALSLIVYFVIFVLMNRLLGSMLDRWTWDWASEGSAFALFLLKNVLLGTVLLFAVMVFDYAKIILVIERSHNVVAETLWALRFVLSHRWITLGIFYAVGLVGMVLTLNYLGLDSLLVPESWWLVMLTFLVQQGFMVSRMWLRVAFYSSEERLYKRMGL